MDAESYNAEKVVVVIKMLKSGLQWTQRLITGIAAIPSPEQSMSFLYYL